MVEFLSSSKESREKFKQELLETIKNLYEEIKRLYLCEKCDCEIRISIKKDAYLYGSPWPLNNTITLVKGRKSSRVTHMGLPYIFGLLYILRDIINNDLDVEKYREKLKKEISDLASECGYFMKNSKVNATFKNLLDRMIERYWSFIKPVERNGKLYISFDKKYKGKVRISLIME